MVGSPERSNCLLPFSDYLKPRLIELDEVAKYHWQAALAQGLPTRQHEDWKYTSLEGFDAIDFSSQRETDVSMTFVQAHKLDMDAERLVFVNGQFQPNLSDIDGEAFRLSLLNGDAKQALPAAIAPEIFLHLTEAFSDTTLLIEVDAKHTVAKPIYLMQIESRPQGGMAHHRVHLKVGQSSEVKIVEHLLSACHGNRVAASYSGSRLTMEVSDNAELTHYKLCLGSVEHYHFAHNDLFVGRDANVSSQTFLLSGQLTRHHTSCQLNGENTEIEINSLALPSHQQTYDTRTYLEHNKGYCTSQQLHKIIASQQGKAVFNGMIKVAPNALKTDGQMDNHNLLLSKACEVNSKPQLEIYADDVKCSHGTTTGALSKEQVFYLQARGLPEHQAEQLITLAFAAEVAEAIDIDVIRTLVLQHIESKLAEVNA
ncbi:Fe-S cluster assembly protein SufD [Vibrio harveyi]|nr:Fe-S cluster assembly protein SufD [Vibrio harveyi]